MGKESNTGRKNYIDRRSIGIDYVGGGSTLETNKHTQALAAAKHALAFIYLPKCFLALYRLLSAAC
jgi:hypothetical protein